MSSPVSTRSSPKTTAPADGDHRKRRRNRTTQSCLNCHATKRMCDRKRPCSRCSQLGISGNCVYEVDDPSRQGKQDEDARLMNRIAELEGVIRELKNKPRPRWLAGSSSPEPASSRISPSDTPPRSGGTSPPNNIPGWQFPSSPGFGSATSGLNFPSGPSQTVPGSPRPSDSLSSLIAAYAGLTDHMFVRRGSNCGCLNETECYSVVLELSLRLRRAADVLSRSPSHSRSSDCALNSHIAHLDMFAKFVAPYRPPFRGSNQIYRNSLLDVPTYDSSLMSGLGRGLGSGRYNPPSSPNIFDQSYAGSGGSSWDMGSSDNFMSWVPSV
ncbi:hypothetical protein FB451DRAFT_1490159 [Mycena latifolia]|nr:hypothetical protein FB451DRAFT_1490159 [Mycena latifolia]